MYVLLRLDLMECGAEVAADGSLLDWLGDTSSKPPVVAGEPEVSMPGADSDFILLESFEVYDDEEDWLTELDPSETDDMVTKDLESDVSLSCSLYWTEPLRLVVPSDIKLADMEDMEMAEGCLHRQHCESPFPW